jgi:hypothetical protein
MNGQENFATRKYLSVKEKKIVLMVPRAEIINVFAHQIL